MHAKRVSLAVVLATCCSPSCSSAQANKLERGTALGILRKAGSSDEIKAEAKTQVTWDEPLWGTGKGYEQVKQRVQSELDFLNRLVDAGVLRRKPDQMLECRAEPTVICKDRHYLLYNYEAIPSVNLRVVFPGQSMSGRSIEFVYLVLAKAVVQRVTGITQEGINATVEFEMGYSPTDLYKRVFPLIRDALAKCPPVQPESAVPNLLNNNLPPSYCGHWPSEGEIGQKKEAGSVEFRRYDDGWRVVAAGN